MAKVKFISRQSPRTGRPEGDPVFEAGQTYDLRDDQARKWVNRQVAEYVGREAKAATAAAEVEAPKPRSAPVVGSGLSKQAEARALRGTNLNDQGTDAPPPPNAMTMADFEAPPQSDASGDLQQRFESGENLNRDLLIELAQQLGVELPSGYNSKDDLRATIASSLESRSGA